jgi:hypothetical protein
VFFALTGGAGQSLLPVLHAVTKLLHGKVSEAATGILVRWQCDISEACEVNRT